MYKIDKIDDHTVKITGIVLEKPFKVSAQAASDALCSVLKRVLV
jgi:predicted peptidase